MRSPASHCLGRGRAGSQECRQRRRVSRCGRGGTGRADHRSRTTDYCRRKRRCAPGAHAAAPGPRSGVAGPEKWANIKMGSLNVRLDGGRARRACRETRIEQADAGCRVHGPRRSVSIAWNPVRKNGYEEGMTNGLTYIDHCIITTYKSFGDSRRGTVLGMSGSVAELLAPACGPRGHSRNCLRC